MHTYIATDLPVSAMVPSQSDAHQLGYPDPWRLPPRYSISGKASCPINKQQTYTNIKNYHEESWTIMKNHELSWKNHELSWRIMTIMNYSYDQKNHWLRWMGQRNPRNHQFWMVETLSRMGCSGHIGHSAGASLESTYFNGIWVLYSWDLMSLIGFYHGSQHSTWYQNMINHLKTS